LAPAVSVAFEAAEVIDYSAELRTYEASAIADDAAELIS